MGCGPPTVPRDGPSPPRSLIAQRSSWAAAAGVGRPGCNGRIKCGTCARRGPRRTIWLQRPKMRCPASTAVLFGAYGPGMARRCPPGYSNSLAFSVAALAARRERLCEHAEAAASNLLGGNAVRPRL